MKVFIQNTTKSQRVAAILDKDSGVITYPDGVVSHILFEKQMQKEIYVYDESIHDELCGIKKPVKEEVKPKADEPSPEQSNAGVKKKTKQK